ncbi:hypothetical protein CONLIGDRAFT_687740 [Coniochaeta ligniaria NRRL 30616]|uniref:Uncharacterized protein n=1 Tax=Coniochaeta ligniaria NRRL 30616 TaxID=1408157 RepID=A0A1J7I4E6_9PEZI|nr:hypothetical protein CONLIGDRAFT_687740 [Coniochaeta ligniaria NRRL 30616]
MDTASPGGQVKDEEALPDRQPEDEEALPNRQPENEEAVPDLVTPSPAESTIDLTFSSVFSGISGANADTQLTSMVSMTPLEAPSYLDTMTSKRNRDMDQESPTRKKVRIEVGKTKALKFDGQDAPVEDPTTVAATDSTSAAETFTASLRPQMPSHAAQQPMSPADSQPQHATPALSSLHLHISEFTEVKRRAAQVRASLIECRNLYQCHLNNAAPTRERMENQVVPVFEVLLDRTANTIERLAGEVWAIPEEIKMYESSIMQIEKSRFVNPSQNLEALRADLACLKRQYDKCEELTLNRETADQYRTPDVRSLLNGLRYQARVYVEAINQVDGILSL